MFYTLNDWWLVFKGQYTNDVVSIITRYASTRYGLNNSYHRQFYRLGQFIVVWTSEMHYFGQHCRIYLFSMYFQLQISPANPYIFENTKNEFFRQIYIKRNEKNHEPANSFFCLYNPLLYKETILCTPVSPVVAISPGGGTGADALFPFTIFVHYLNPLPVAYYRITSNLVRI